MLGKRNVKYGCIFRPLQEPRRKTRGLAQSFTTPVFCTAEQNDRQPSYRRYRGRHWPPSPLLPLQPVPWLHDSRWNGSARCHCWLCLCGSLLTTINQDIGPSVDISWVSMTYTLTIAVGLMYVFTTPGGAFAPAIGESFVRNTSSGWRGVFYVLIAIDAVALLCFTQFYWPPRFRDKHGGQSKWTYVRQFDYIGTLLFVAGLLLFLMGLTWGGSRYPWGSSYVIATMVVGGVLFIAFILWGCYAPIHQPSSSVPQLLGTLTGVVQGDPMSISGVNT
ncbi:fungal trichothecene efflux pump-domain-containing protein [Aspergillus spectabilis]